MGCGRCCKKRCRCRCDEEVDPCAPPPPAPPAPPPPAPLPPAPPPPAPAPPPPAPPPPAPPPPPPAPPAPKPAPPPAPVPVPKPPSTCPIGTAFIDGECKPIGRLLSALIKKCIYTDSGRKLDERMYLDLFGEEPSNTFIETGKKSPSGISILNIYSDKEYIYHAYDGPGSFKAIKITSSDILNDRTILKNLADLSNKDTVQRAMKNIAIIFNKKAEEKVRIVALFFNIALVIYSLYYKKADHGDVERKNTSLRNVFYSTLKPFMIPAFSSVVGNSDEAIMNKFIKYYDSASGIADPGTKQTARLKSLRSATGGKSKTRKHSKTLKKSKKYTRRK